MEIVYITVFIVMSVVIALLSYEFGALQKQLQHKEKEKGNDDEDEVLDIQSMFKAMRHMQENRVSVLNVPALPQKEFTPEAKVLMDRLLATDEKDEEKIIGELVTQIMKECDIKLMSESLSGSQNQSITGT